MNLDHVHLLLNHLPVIGVLITLVLFAVSLVSNQDDMKQTSLILFALIALITIPTYISGNGAQEAIRESPGISMPMVESHQGAAFLAFTLMELTGVASLIGLFRFSRSAKDPRMSTPSQRNLLTVLALAIVTAGFMALAGNTGGNIRHSEILASGEEPSAFAAAGVQLTAWIQHFVIDTSMWVWPIIEDFHFFGLILLLGSVGALNLRILGVMKRLPVAPLQRFIPWGIAGFAINVITGFLFYVGMPGFYVLNFVFQFKIFAIVLGGANLLLFHCTSAFRAVEDIGPGEDAPVWAKVVAASSIIIWLAVIVLGRYIPFGEVA
jgi:hypothetical protein